MATQTQPKLSAVEDDFDEALFPRKDLEFRGKHFVFRELSGAEYDACVENSTHDGVVDSVQLLRWMIVKSSVEPKLTAAAVGKLPFQVLGAIGKVVNDLHFGEENLEPLAQRLRDAGWKIEAPETDEGPKD